MRKPWMKFYPQDWLSDPMLRICDLSARGLLIELMAIAWNTEKPGYLIANGLPMPTETITKLIGIRPQTYRKAIANLHQTHRIGTSNEGVLFIPRMVKDAEYTSKQAEYGKQGGNPTLIPPLKVEQSRAEIDKSRAEKNITFLPETENAESLKAKYNDMAEKYGLPRVRAMNRERVKKANARIKEGLLDNWGEVETNLGKSSFAQGSNGWRVSFDWLIENPKNWVKIWENHWPDSNNKQNREEIKSTLEG